MRAAFPVMHELRDHLDEGEFLARVEEMRATGYRLVAVEDEGRITALAGIGIGLNLYYGRYLWVYDLVTNREARSRGHGLRLMRHLEEVARDELCDTLALSSALHRLDAHRFYEDKVGMEKTGFTFKKDLT